MEREPSSPSQNSLWPIAVLGIFVSTVALFTSKRNRSGKPTGPEDSTGHTNSPHPPEVRPVIHVVPASQKEPETKTISRADRVPWWRLLVDSAALLVAIGLLYFNFRQAKATEQAAKTAAQAATTAQKQLEMSERPWMSAEFSIQQPIEFQANGDVGVQLHVVLKNIGHSVATDVRLALGADPEGRGLWFKKIGKEQKEMCETWRNLKSLPDNGSSTTLFPGESYIENTFFKVTKEQIDKVEAQVGGKRVITGISLFGCVDYRFAFASEHHQTGFSYDLIKPAPLPTHPPKFGEAIGGALYMNIGENIPPSQLTIRRSIFGGFYVD